MLLLEERAATWPKSSLMTLLQGRKEDISPATTAMPILFTSCRTQLSESLVVAVPTYNTCTSCPIHACGTCGTDDSPSAIQPPWWLNAMGYLTLGVGPAALRMQPRAFAC